VSDSDVIGTRAKALHWSETVADWLATLPAVCKCELPLRVTALEMAELCRRFGAGQGHPSQGEVQALRSILDVGAGAIEILRENRTPLAESVSAGDFLQRLGAELGGAIHDLNK
jgi:hypothetical protein